MANEVTKVSGTGNAVVKSDKTIKGMLANPETAWGKELAKLLPGPKEVARFMSCAMAQLADPKVGGKLAACTLPSFYNAIMKSARSGIMPDGVNAYLIPYGKECTLQYSYRGLCDMAVREGIAKKFIGDIVRENDVFKWSNGELVEHTVDAWDEESRGAIVGVWVRAILPDGDHQDLRMSKKDIDQIKSKSQNPNGVWKEWYEEMAKKSAVKRLMKMMRNTPALQEAIATDNENYDLNKPVDGRSARVAQNNINFDDDEVIDVDTKEEQNDDVTADDVI